MKKDAADSYMQLLSTQQILNGRYNFIGLIDPYFQQHDSIATVTVNRCLNSMTTEHDLLQKQNLKFIFYFTESSNSRFFKFFYNYQDTINKIHDPAIYTKGMVGFSQAYLEKIITQEEMPGFDLKLKTSTEEPDWTKYYKRIEKKYSQDFAERIIARQKMRWYEYGLKKNFTLSAQSILEYLDDMYIKHATHLDVYDINGDLWSIFLHCSDKELLKKALTWNERLFSQQPQTLKAAYIVDTYANLLYKNGNVSEGIKWEQKAIELNPKSQTQQDELEKMKKGLPTW